jgi:hypothetical protein
MMLAQNLHWPTLVDGSLLPLHHPADNLLVLPDQMGDRRDLTVYDGKPVSQVLEASRPKEADICSS